MKKISFILVLFLASFHIFRNASSQTRAASASYDIWITQSDIMQLPTTGTGWNNVLSDAQQDTYNPDLNDRGDDTDVYTLAKALVYARTGDIQKRDEVYCTLAKLVKSHQIVWDSTENRWEPMDSNGQPDHTMWSWTAVVRSAGSYVIAANLIDLESYPPHELGDMTCAAWGGMGVGVGFSDRDDFKPWIDHLRTTMVEDDGSGGARGSLVTMSEKRPNNLGNHARASRIAIDLYLFDNADLARTMDVFNGYLGATQVYDEYDPAIDGPTNCEPDGTMCRGFVYGSLHWQCDENNPVGINPQGCTKTDGQGNTWDIDGVQPDDQRRHNPLQLEAPCALEDCDLQKYSYNWEGAQGVVTTAELLYVAGFTDVYTWENEAVWRLVDWMYRTTFVDINSTNPPTGDDQWIPHILNVRYSNHPTRPTNCGVSPGKMVGYTDWTHSACQ